MDQEIDKLFRDINGELEKIISEKNNTNASIKKKY